MVNIARTMGLDMDPDEFPGKFSLFEAESRRRLWWDIFYYDLFVSDYMGRTPLISDMEHTTRLPMDVDEDVFTPACTSIPLPRSPLSPLEPNSSDFKYFGLKCRLAQLVKDIKKRSLRDCVRNDLAAHEQFTLEQAVSCANEIKQWLADLPSAFRLDIPSDLPNVQGSHSQSSDAVNSSPPSANPSDLAAVSPILLAQRCELAITAHRLIMKVYVPFLRPSYGHGDSTSYYQATVGAFTAAHSIIHSLRVLCWMWKQRPDLKGRRPMPALFNFYSFGRALFDAAVACVHNVIKDPTSVWVHIAVEDVNYALEVMRDPMLNTGRGSMRGGIEGTVHEAVKIVELLQKKAEGVRAGNSDAAAAGIKRKYDDLEVGVQRLHKDFQFPFVGVPVASGGSSVHPPSSTVSSSAPCPRPLPSGPGPNHRVQNTSHANPAEEQSKHVPLQPPVGPKRGSSISSDGSKCKDKHTKKPPYPQTGIRVRPGKEPSPFSMLRTSLSSAAVKPSANSEVAMPPAPLPPSRAPSVVSTPNLEHPPYHQSSPFAQITQTTSSPSSVMNMHHSSTPLSSDGTVDFTLPFGAADQVRAQTQMDIDLSQPGRYGVAGMDQNVTNSQQFSKVSPPIPSYEQTHNAPYNSSSPASYAPSSGSYSNLSSPYTNNGPQFSNGPPPPHDQRSAPFDMSASMQNYYPYGPRYQETANVQPHPVSLVTVDVEPPISMNHGGEDPQFQMRDSTVSREGSVFQYQHDKSHLGMYAMKPPERHASMPQSPFPESHNQPMTQPWHQETAALHENSGFWRSYD
ncbi:hypothetical protein BDN67DRAFT_166858 [Paxillus ammoniavirescens]|nr:hypothetical protein BDN67DRAFT_166858 [Paxillus ammoniavirescens]